MANEFDSRRFEALVLHIAHRTKDVPDFGRTKLAKVLFYSDFDAFRAGGESITGATYVRMPFGPFPRELDDAEHALQRTGQIDLDYDKEDYDEKRIVPIGPPPDVSQLFEGWHLVHVDHWISEISAASARRISELSHEHPGWRLARESRVEIPYATHLLPQERPTALDAENAKQIARERGWLRGDGWTWEREPV